MKKIVCKGYFLTDYEKEEQWLHDMRLQGWALTAIPFPYFYTFEKTAPKDVTYRLEFRPGLQDREDYINLAGEYGWSCMKGPNSWLYFRKDTAEQTEDNEIFTDDCSRMQMVKKTAKARFLPGLMLTAVLAVMYVIVLLSDAGLGYRIAYGAVLLMLALLDIHMILGYRRLSAKYARVMRS